MIKCTLNSKILNLIEEINQIKVTLPYRSVPLSVQDSLRKISMKKSAYYSNKIEGNSLTYDEALKAIDSYVNYHGLTMENEIRNYYLALSYLNERVNPEIKLTKELILDVQKMVEKGASKEKIGFRGPMPAGVLFAVVDANTGDPDYIPPEYSDVEPLLDELIDYVNSSDDHPLIKAAIVHYQLVTIHPFEDGNGRTARLISGYILACSNYNFLGIGSLEEYFSYSKEEYYASLQMNLPPLYYNGRDNPPHPEIWITYFLKMVLFQGKKVLELVNNENGGGIKESLSYLNKKELEFLSYLLKKNILVFKPSDIAKKLNVTNKTIINWSYSLAKNGFLAPNLVKSRVISYSLCDFSRKNSRNILDCIKELR